MIKLFVLLFIPLPKRVQAWLYRAAADDVKDAIVVAKERRYQALVAAEKINAWIVEAESSERELRAKSAALTDPKKLLDEALSNRNTR